MNSTEGMRLNLTRTACKVAAQRGWTADEIKDCFEHPKKVYASKNRPGQFRVVNDRICIVGVPDGERFVGITMYPNGSEAPVK